MVIAGSDTLDVRDAAAVAARIKGSVSSKQFGYEDLLCPLIAQACIGVCPKNPVSFNVDNVRCLLATLHIRMRGSRIAESRRQVTLTGPDQEQVERRCIGLTALHSAEQPHRQTASHGFILSLSKCEPQLSSHSAWSDACSDCDQTADHNFFHWLQLLLIGDGANRCGW